MRSSPTCGSEMLEHRWLQRCASNLEVRLYRQGEAVGTVFSLDMSSQGIGIECQMLDLHKGEVVEIDLSESNTPKGMQSHARCFVIYAGKVRCGLMFLDMDKAT